MPVPRLRDDLIIERLDGGARVRDRAGGELFALSAPGLWLLLRLDGLADADELLAEHAALFPPGLPLDEFDAWAEDLGGMGALVHDDVALQALRYLADEGFSHRGPAPDRRGAERGEGRRQTGNEARWFDHAIYHLNDGDLDAALAIFERFVEADPAGVRFAELVVHLRGLRDGSSERRDVTWRVFDDALAGLLAAGTCPACGAGFEVRPGSNRCVDCGAHFTSWILEHPAVRQRENP